MNTLVKRKPVTHFSFPSIFDAFNEIAHTSSSFSPSVNISENDDRFLISLALPGFAKKEVKIELDKNKLIIKSELEKASEESTQKYRRREFVKSSFEKSFILSDNVDKESLKAQFKNGILNIDIAKMPEAKPISIKVS